MKNKICILVHFYYEDSWEEFSEYFSSMPYEETNFLFNISLDNPAPESFIGKIKVAIPKAICIVTSNVGKDVGAKLHLFDLAMRLEMEGEYVLLLHDKKSPHTVKGADWRKKLMKIAEKEQIDEIMDLFSKNAGIGIIGSSDFIRNEYNAQQQRFSCTSDLQLKEQLTKYDLQPASYDFIAGTMFWGRSIVLKDFFAKHSALSIRAQLEKGNVLDHNIGTYTHSWERILNWLYTANGYKLKGI